MNTLLIGATIAIYLLVLFFTSWLSGRRGDNATFFIGNRQSPWYVVAIGMVGASISGVTFISVPGWVGATGFSYMQMVFGYFVGYVVIANILLPLYYRLNLISIYAYLEQRFGVVSYRTGSVLFMVSRLAGSAARLYLMVNVLQFVLFDALHIPFYVTTILTLLVIWLYTHRSGLRTIIFTDTLQTLIFITCVAVTFVVLGQKMGLSVSGAVDLIVNSSYARLFEWSDWRSTGFFWKQFLTGAFITIVMTGLDQDMMQKNLSCRSIKDAQKNMYSYGFAFIPVNLLFLALGALLFLFVQSHHIPLPAKADDLFPTIVAGGYLPPVVTVLFVLGLMAAALSSADSTLTSLTTSFSLDILNVDKMGKPRAEQARRLTHIGFSILTGALIFIFYWLGQDTIIGTIFTMAGYTYGPLLGLYVVGLFTRWRINDRLVPMAAILAPVVTGVVDFYDTAWFGFKLGYEALLINGALMVFFLLVSSLKTPFNRVN
ncbi:MAG: sodium:solute symporter [Breznakibacter sp.]